MNKLEGWNDHLVPIGETGTEWEQVAEIPVKHWTQTDFHTRISVEHFWYLYKCVDLGVNVGGSTLQEAEVKIRRVLTFDLDFASGKLSVSPSEKILEMAKEVSQYYQPKAQ